MSNNTTVYVPKSSAKARDNQFGETEINLSFQAAAFIEFVKENTNAKGYINLRVAPRKSPSDYGDTHSVKLDTWVPKENAEAKPAAAKPKATPAKKAPAADVPEDDIPF